MTDQYDLFGEVEARERSAAADDRQRRHDGWHVLAWHFPHTLELLYGVDRWVAVRGGRNLDQGGEVGASYSGEWAYSPRRDGLYFESGATWGGWSSRPRHRLTWAEIQDDLAVHDAERCALRARAEWMIEAADAMLPDWWRHLYRPHELDYRGGAGWHPDYIASDHALARWPDRLEAWTCAIALCDLIRDEQDGTA